MHKLINYNQVQQFQISQPARQSVHKKLHHMYTVTTIMCDQKTVNSDQEKYYLLNMCNLCRYAQYSQAQSHIQ